MRTIKPGFDSYLKSSEGYEIRLRRDEGNIMILDLAAYRLDGKFNDPEKYRACPHHDDTLNGSIRMEWDPSQGGTVVTGIRLNQGAYNLKKADPRNSKAMWAVERLSSNPENIPADSRIEIQEACQWIAKEMVALLRAGKPTAQFASKLDQKLAIRQRIKKELLDSISPGPEGWEKVEDTNWTKPEKYVAAKLCRMMYEGIRNAGSSKLELPTRKDLADCMKKDFPLKSRMSEWELKSSKPVEIVDTALNALGLGWLK